MQRKDKKIDREERRRSAPGLLIEQKCPSMLSWVITVVKFQVLGYFVFKLEYKIFTRSV